MDREDLADRIAAVERRLTDGETDCRPLADEAALVARLDDLEARAEDVDERLAEVESAVQALRGYVGGVERVNGDVERRANAAVARVERLEERLDGTSTTRSEPVDGEHTSHDRVESADGGRTPGDRAERAAMAARDAGTRYEGDDPAGSDPGRSLVGRLRDALS